MAPWKPLTAILAATCWILPSATSTPVCIGQEDSNLPNVTRSVPADSIIVSPAPSIILRPSTVNETPLENCVIEVNPVGGSQRQEFALKIAIPDSVSVIEIQPNNSTQSKRNFRIRLDQPVGSDALDNISPATTLREIDQIGEPSARTAHSTNKVLGRHTQIPIMQTRGSLNNQHQSIPASSHANPDTVPISAGQKDNQGFTSNPFFNSTASADRLNPHGPIEANFSDVISRGVTASLTDSHEYAAPVSYAAPVRVDSFDFENVAQPIPTFIQSNTTPLAPIHPIHAKIFGPTALGLGVFGEYVLEITNSSPDDSGEIAIDLNVPIGQEVALLGPTAVHDSGLNKVTWKVANVEGNARSLIRYRLRTTATGSQTHDVTVSVKLDAESPIKTNFETRVMLEFESLDAPKPDFGSESNPEFESP